ncbi:MAG: InlB B-repeat-containing protein [Lachnospiraceae bacterium]|nr:InlB B-repeat-containing protein [Lachnospiraceae bacterium]
MKNRQKRLLALLLAGAMMALPVSQAFAETSYDASAGVEQRVLFPKDSLTGITAGLTVDGTQTEVSEDGSWTNTDDGKVYVAETAEDGSIQITQAGYELEVESGTASLKDGDDTYHHYSFGDWEQPDDSLDRAYYQKGDMVTIKADEPKEGMEFAGWKCETDGVEIADASSAETTFEMLNRKVKITATYQESKPQEYVVTVNNGEGSGSYEVGSEVTIAAPDRSAEGYEFTGWSVDTGNVSLNDASSLTTGFAMPEGDVTLTAGYTEIVPEPVSYAVTVNNGEGSGSYEAGSWVTVTAPDRSAEGYEFTGWSVDTGNVSLADTSAEETAFTMPEGNVTLTAAYTEIPQTETEPAAIETEAPETEPISIETEAPETEPAAIETEAPETEPISIETEAPETEPISIETEAPETEPGAIETEAPETEPISIETEAPETEPGAIETEAPETEQKYEVTVNNGIGSGEYAAGEIVSVEAPYEGEDGEVFEMWESTSNVQLEDVQQPVTTFVMPENSVELTAVYAAAKYTVTVENGTADTDEIEAGKTVTVTADDRFEEGLKFSHWEGSAVVDGEENDVIFADKNAETTSFTMPSGDTSVKAVYEEKIESYRVSVANGLINGTSTEMFCDENEEITVTANPSASGQQFSRWIINDGTYDIGDAAYDETISLTVTEDLDILATYEGVSYAVTVKNGTANYDECVSGTVVTITADKAPEGYEFDTWTVDTQNVSLADAYKATTTFTMPEGEVTVSASYKKIVYTVKVENGNSDQQYYYAGDTVTVTSNYPASGREFNKWEAVSGNVSFADSSRWKTTFTMPATNVSLRATYKDGPSPDDNQILDLKAGAEYYIGDTIKFTASGAGMSNSNPNPGDYRYRPSAYQISNVSGVLQTPYSISMAIKEAGEYTVKVTYNKDIYDGTNWVSDGTTDAKSVTFKVIPKSAAVQTGDETPIAMVVALAVVSCAVFVILLVIFLRRRKNNRKE